MGATAAVVCRRVSLWHDTGTQVEETFRRVIELQDGGFRVLVKPEPALPDGELFRIRWTDVQEIVAYKLDLMAVDCICLGFRTQDEADYYEVVEEDRGYKELASELERVFPEIRNDWFQKVAFPAFETNWTTIWGQPLNEVSVWRRRASAALIAGNRTEHRSTMWLIDLLYILLALFAWPVLLVLFLAKKKWRDGFWERMGLVPRLAPHPCRIWVHAISVGESEAARPLVAALRQRFPEAELVISTTTRTGRTRAQKLYPGLTLFHYPLDFPWAVSAALRRIKPTLIVQVETEWWPCFLFKAARRGIPVAMVNVRTTERSAGRYAHAAVSWLFRRMVNVPAVIAVQNETYRERLARLGASPARLFVTGQMKYDGVSFAAPPGVEALARDVGLAPGELAVVAGSTAAGEEEILLDVYRRLKAECPALRLVIVPRHPERFDEVAGLITARGFPLVRRSQTKSAPASPDPAAVILGDTMGELMAFYAAGAVAFIGRSLVPIGGSNPIDPASLGLPLLFGPHMFNFPEAQELFADSGAARRVADADSLTRSLAEMLQSPDLPAEMGRRARQAVRTRQGATARNVELLADVLAAATQSPLPSAERGSEERS